MYFHLNHFIKIIIALSCCFLGCTNDTSSVSEEDIHTSQHDTFVPNDTSATSLQDTDHQDILVSIDATTEDTAGAHPEDTHPEDTNPTLTDTHIHDPDTHIHDPDTLTQEDTPDADILTCTTDCNALPNVETASCLGDQCGDLVCTEDFADCDADPSNGCEINLLTNRSHCGGCDLGCDLTNNANVISCEQGLCAVLTCFEGFGDCDQEYENGCECVIDLCGNGVLDRGEQCDGGNLQSASCDADCTGVVCGDGLLNTLAGEQCDDGNTNNGDGCSQNCQTTPICGDGQRTHTEACDDGNTLNGDGCSDTCTEEFGFCCYNLPGGLDCTFIFECGNGVVNSCHGVAVEDCDAINLPTNTCDVDCTFRACGDGVRNAVAGETCDDGNTQNSDGCSSTCTIENGAVCTGPNNGLSTCITLCGNGVLDPGEACDDVNLPTASCNTNCTLLQCGDGVKNLAAGEQCDAPTLPTRDCDIDCTYRICGDGLLNSNGFGFVEQCDDGNLNDYDGCNSFCRLEPGHSCTTPPNAQSTCTRTSALQCGDGLLNADEECDDGNQTNGDGCSYLCKSTSCAHNAQLDPGEECDDGNQTNGDGCSQDCLIESGFCCTATIGNLSSCTGQSCGNGFIGCGGAEQCEGLPLPTTTCDVNCTFAICGDAFLNQPAGEQCDDGNTQNGDGCSQFCMIE